MRILVSFIFLLLCQHATANGQRNLCTSNACSKTVDSCQLSVDFHESQIRKADSLYKNYLPQTNFEEVKAAMEFFDSLRLSTVNSQRTTDFFHRIAYPQTVDRFPLSIDFKCAQTHYYHAVGLTEKDDVVAACEHYIIALEIMEDDDFVKKLSNTKKYTINQDNYEKIRFIALIYIRLGQLFYNENYCNIAIIKYKNALKYIDLLGDNNYKASILKSLGNALQLSNKPNDALYYYNESLKINSSANNKLDIDKCLAQIMFDKGERNGAYVILKNNLDKIHNESVKYSYHFALGNMFYFDREYDSAIYYLEKSLDKSIITQKVAFTTKLSSIYDSLGNYEKRAYYDNLSSKLLINSTNKSIDKSKLQAIYEEYNERKQAKIKSITQKRSVILCSIFLIIVFSTIITIKYKHKKHNEKLSELIKEKDQYIKRNDFKNALIEGKIKRKNAELQQKDMQIKSQQIKINELQCRLENRKDNLKEYYQSEICAKILNKIDELSRSHKMTSDLEPLSQEEFVILLQSANSHLGEFIKNISNRYPSFKKEDLYYLCLVALNLKDKQIAALFNVTYNAIRSRRKKICTLLGIDINENIYKKLIL